MISLFALLSSGFDYLVMERGKMGGCIYIYGWLEFDKERDAGEELNNSTL